MIMLKFGINRGSSLYYPDTNSDNRFMINVKKIYVD